MGTPSNLRLGPGLLYIAPLATTEPTTLTGAPDVGFVALGYTETGHEFESNPTYQDVEVAEEIDPVNTVKSKRILTLTVSAVEMLAKNWKIAMNGGTISAPTGGYVTFDPPAASATDTHVMILWQADDNKERWLFRECSQMGAIKVPRHKGADKALLPMSFRILKPAGVQPFKAWFSSELA